MTNKKYGVITVNRTSATIGFLDGSRHLVVRGMDSPVPSTVLKKKHPFAPGRGYERLIEIAIHEWFETVSTAAHRLFRDQRLDAILVSGSAAERFVLLYF